MSDDKVLQHLEQLAIAAGREIMRLFFSTCAETSKTDLSPVTEADNMAEAMILDGLRSTYHDIPCVAEEEVASAVLPNYLGHSFFLVDPLDGTREFIERRDDFTVNIALIRTGEPAIGVVYAPAKRRLYSGFPGNASSVEISPNLEITRRKRINVRTGVAPLTIVASRSHRTSDTEAFIRQHSDATLVSIGSSLKFCLVASGQADIYPRFGRTMEWDTAAGHAVLNAAGGRVVQMDGTPLLYGKRRQEHDVDFANPWFIAEGARRTV